MPERSMCSRAHRRSAAHRILPTLGSAGAIRSRSETCSSVATGSSWRAASRLSGLSCQTAGPPVPIILTREGAMKLQDERLFRQHCYIDGEWVDAINRATIRVTNPANGETLGTVPRMGAEETRRAIEAADRALPAWRAKTAKERAQILRRWFDLLMANQEDLAALMTAEQGKPLAESKGEIAYAASFIEWFGEEGKRIYGDTIPSHGADKRIVVIKEPIGVCAAITPWNFPAAMITRKCGPALAAGCTMVLKPATATPYSALALCELAERAGVP